MVMRGREITYKAMEKNKKLQQEIDTMIEIMLELMSHVTCDLCGD